MFIYSFIQMTLVKVDIYRSNQSNKVKQKKFMKKIKKLTESKFHLIIFKKIWHSIITDKDPSPKFNLK